MTATLLPDAEAAPSWTLIQAADVPEDEWRKARRRGIGSSDVASVLGVSKFGGALTVYAEKVHGYQVPVTIPMELGHVLEPWIVARFAKLHPELDVVAKPGMFQGTQPWHLATPDGLAGPAGQEPTDLVEAKTANRWSDAGDPDEGWGTPGTDEVPWGYLCQVTWSCRIRRLTRWHMPVLFDQRDYREYRGEYSQELGDQLAEYIDRWWFTHVVAGVEPLADGLDSTRLMLASRHVAKRKTKGQFPYEALAWAEEYLTLRDQKKQIEADMAERANKLRQAHVAAECHVGMVGDIEVSSFARSSNGVVTLNVKDSAR